MIKYKSIIGRNRTFKYYPKNHPLLALRAGQTG